MYGASGVGEMVRQVEARGMQLANVMETQLRELEFERDQSSVSKPVHSGLQKS